MTKPNEIQITSGPWWVQPAGGESQLLIAAEGAYGDIEIARVYSWAEYARGPLPAKANARYIAAVPELVAELRRLTLSLEDKGADPGLVEPARMLLDRLDRGGA